MSYMCHCGVETLHCDPPRPVTDVYGLMHYREKPCETIEDAVRALGEVIELRHRLEQTQDEHARYRKHALEQLAWARKERDEARADHLRVRDECFANMDALTEMTRERDSLRTALVMAETKP